MSSCATCGNLAEHVAADLKAGEALPPEVSRLEAIAGTTARRCPTCGALFLYTYDYEYGALGDGWEDAALDRVDRDRVVAVLLASPPSSAVNVALAELGVADGEAAITTKLLADLDDPAASYEAVRKLVTACLARSDLAAIDRLLHHPRAKVRSDTLYLLQTYRGSLVFRAVAATTDPSSAVRDAATTAAFVDPPRDVGLEPMITACLDDPDDDVRSNAAWALAVFADDKRDVSAALPALMAKVRDTPLDWLLAAEEVAELWSLGIPLDAACVPDDQLRLAIASRRVKYACSSSSMGTAETYWAVAEPTDGLVLICRNGVVMPPGETAQETAFEDRADDRDVHKVLWVPVLREQRAAIARAVPQERRPMIVDAYARILADLEERWAKGAKRIERAPFLEWLRTDGPVDAELERWLREHNKRSVDHLVQGIRARWLTHDVAAAFDAVMTSVERFTADRELQRSTRIELLRCAARVVRAR